MRSYPSCWNTTLAKLGFKRKVRSKPKSKESGRRSQIETLEQRQMLAADLKLTATVRDFNSDHPHFESPNIYSLVGMSGLVEPVLTNGKPVLTANITPQEGFPVISLDPAENFAEHKQYFDAWYRDIPETNESIDVTWDFLHVPAGDSNPYTEGTDDVDKYVFTGSDTNGLKTIPTAYFPIDGLLKNEQGFTDFVLPGEPPRPAVPHNFHFTTELRAAFTYRQGQDQAIEFFRTDDDAWLFIDGKLVYDSGGVKANWNPGKVDFDSLVVQDGTLNGTPLVLVDGQEYSFDFFTAERHTRQSAIVFEIEGIDSLDLRDITGELDLVEGQSLVKRTDNHPDTEFVSPYVTIAPGSNFGVIQVDITDIAFDGTSVPGESKDAIELAWLAGATTDVDQTIFPTVGGGSDAFFNLSEGQLAPLTADGITYEWLNPELTAIRVFLDTSHIDHNLLSSAFNYDASTAFVGRIVNNDSDDTTTATFDFQVDGNQPTAAAAGNQGLPSIPWPDGPDKSGQQPISSFDEFEDVSDSVDVTYTYSGHNRENGQVSFGLNLRHNGTRQLKGGLIMAVHNIRDQETQAPNPNINLFSYDDQLSTPAAGLPADTKYINLTSLLGPTDTVSPIGGSIGNLLLEFRGIDGTQVHSRFDFDVTFLGEFEEKVTIIEGEQLLSTGAGSAEAVESFTIPSDPGPILIDLHSLRFDSNSNTGQRLVHDAFELALLDAAGNSVVPTIGDPSVTDAFLSISESQDLSTATGAFYAPGVHLSDYENNSSEISASVALDLSGVPAGTPVTLVARLVNNDVDNTTRAVVDLNVRNSLPKETGPIDFSLITPSYLPTNPTVTLAGPVDEARLVNVTSNFAYTHGVATFDQDSGTSPDGELAAAIDLTNNNVIPIRDRLLLMLDGANGATWTNSSGVLSQPLDLGAGVTFAAGTPYLDLSNAFNRDSLNYLQAGTISDLLLTFAPLANNRFDITPVLVGYRNDAPSFQGTVPSDRVNAGETLTFDSQPTDPDEDGTITTGFATYTNLAGETVTITSPSAEFTVSTNGQVSFTPDAALIADIQRDPDDIKRVQFELTVDDGQPENSVGAETFIIELNTPPDITNYPGADGQGSDYVLPEIVNAPIGDVSVTYSDTSVRQVVDGLALDNVSLETTVSVDLSLRLHGERELVDVFVLQEGNPNYSTGAIVPLPDGTFLNVNRNQALAAYLTDDILYDQGPDYQSLVSRYPEVNFAFGVGTAESYPRSLGAENNVPFTLKNPLLEVDDPRFEESLFDAILRDMWPYGGAGATAYIEALYQLATGVGLDGNLDGDRTDVGLPTDFVPRYESRLVDPEGSFYTANFDGTPGESGDVAPFDRFVSNTKPLRMRFVTVDHMEEVLTGGVSSQTLANSSFGLAGRSDFYRFEATAGDLITLSNFQVARPSDHTESYGAEEMLQVYDPDDAVVAEYSIEDIANAGTPVVLPALVQDGTYVLTIKDVPRSNGLDYSFDISKTAGTPPTTPAFFAIDGTTVYQGTFPVGGTTQNRIEDVYPLRVTKPTWLHVDTLSGNSNIEFDVLKEDGSFTDFRFENFGTNTADTLELEAGNYSLVVYSDNTGTTGDYTFRLMDVRDSSQTHDIVTLPPTGSVTVNAIVGNSTAIHKFHANRNDAIDLSHASNNAGSVFRWDLLDPFGRSLNLQSDLDSLPATGTYTLVLAASYSSPPSYAIETTITRNELGTPPNASLALELDSAASETHLNDNLQPGERLSFQIDRGAGGARTYIDALDGSLDVDAYLLDESGHGLSAGFAEDRLPLVSTTFAGAPGSRSLFGPILSAPDGYPQLIFEMNDDYGFVPSSGGELGGAGFREGALPIIVIVSHSGPTTASSLDESLVTINGLNGPLDSISFLTGRDENNLNVFHGTQYIDFVNAAQVQPTIDALNAVPNGIPNSLTRGAQVVGVNANPSSTFTDSQALLTSLATLTGALNTNSQPIYHQVGTINGPDPEITDVSEAIMAAVQDVLDARTQPLVELRSTNPDVQLLNAAGGAISPIQISGDTINFDDVYFKAASLQGVTFDVEFVQVDSGEVLGRIPGRFLGNRYEADIVAVDPEGDDLNFALTNDPALVLSGSNLATLTGTGNERTFVWDPTNVTEGDYTFTVTVDDNLGGQDQETWTITVDQASHADHLPFIDLNGDDEEGTGFETEFSIADQTPVGIAQTGDPEVALNNASIRDLNNANLSEMTVVISDATDGISEKLLYGTPPAGLTTTWDQTSHTLTVAGNASVDDYEQVLHSIQYKNENQGNPGGTRDIVVTVWDRTPGAIVPTTNQAVARIRLVDENQIPTLFRLTTPVLFLDENNDANAQTLISRFQVIDDSLGTNKTLLYGPNSDLFQFELAAGTTDTYELRLKDGVVLDYETLEQNPLGVSVDIEDVGLGSNDMPFEYEIIVRNVPEPPVITGPAAGTPIHIQENNSIVTDVTATDEADTPPTFAVNAAVLDGGLFTIDPDGRKLRFVVAPDHEMPASSLLSNTYQVEVVVTDDEGQTATRTITVNVDNVNEDPVITTPSTISVPENSLLVTTLTADDPEGGDVSFSVAANPQEANLFWIPPGTDNLQFINPQDFESRAPVEHTYSVTVIATDAGEQSVSKMLTINLTDVDEAPFFKSFGGQATASVEIPENTGNVLFRVSDPDAEPVDREPVVFVDNTYEDGNLFGITQQLDEYVVWFITPVDYESLAEPEDAFTVRVVAEDANDASLSSSQIVTISIGDVNEAPVFDPSDPTSFSVDENTTFVTTLDAEDPELDTVEYLLSGADASKFWVNSANQLVFYEAPDFETPASAAGSNTYQVIVTADDQKGETTPISYTIDVAPVDELPSITFSNAVLSLPEDLPSGATTKVADITIDDDTYATASGSYILTPAGPNADLFQIVDEALYISLDLSQTLNYESQPLLSVTVTIDDPSVGTGVDASANFSLIVTDVNDAPFLGDGDFVHTFDWDIAEADNTGIRVSDLLVNAADDDLGENDVPSDSLGIAITATDNTYGEIEYRLDDSSSWQQVGSVSETAALLLSNTASLRMKRLPAAPVFDTLQDAVTFRAWDISEGAPDDRLDISASTSVSAAAEEARLGFQLDFATLGELVVTVPDDTPNNDYTPTDLNLREAIVLAGLRGGDDTITFAPGIDAINLAGGKLVIDSNVTITGLGADLLTLDAAGAPNVFHITQGSDVSITDLTVTGASLAGILSEGSLTVLRAEITGNVGGGIDSQSNSSETAYLVIADTAVTDNQAVGVNLAHTDATLTNVTISGNSGTGEAGGLNILLGTATLENSTVFDNRVNSSDSTSGLLASGGIRISWGGAVTLHNSIVVGNVAGASGTPIDLDATYGSVTASSSHNIVGVEAVASTLSSGANNNRVATTAEVAFTPLGHYGGPTRTHALNAGSVAINGGDTNTIGHIDQRGFLQSVVLDVGAFQSQSASTQTVNTLSDTSAAQGEFTLRQAIELAEALDGPNTIEFDPGLAGGTVLLEQGALVLDSQIDILGPGSDKLTIDAQGNSRVIEIEESGDVELSDIRITNGATETGGGFSLTRYGGGIFTSGDLTLRRVHLLNNDSYHYGGGLYHQSPNDALYVVDTIFEGNTSAQGGAVFTPGNAVFERTTFVGNESTPNAQGGGNGGAIRIGGGGNGEIHVINSTFSANEAALYGGAIAISTQTKVLRVTNSTIYENEGLIGGLTVFSGDVYLNNSILVGNINPANGDAKDLSGSLNPNSWFNLIGNEGSNGPGNTNDNLINVTTEQVKLTPLGNYGGLTPTHALESGSLAIDYSIVDLATDANGSLLTTDQRGFDRNVDSGDPGPPSLTVDAGAFEFSTTLSVDTLSDSADNTSGFTLRDALALAEVIDGPNEITFDPSLTSGSVLLEQGPLTINSEVTITGRPGSLITIDAQASSRVFEVGSGGVATLQDLTVTGGNANNASLDAGYGGGVHSTGDLTLTRVRVNDNHASQYGGGVFDSSGTLTIQGSYILDNTSAQGGGVFSSGNATIESTTFENNIANDGLGGGSGGGLRIGGSGNAGAVNIINSTFSANDAAISGGAISLSGGSHDVTIVNSTIYNNTGGGIVVFSGNAELQNTIVAGNTIDSGAPPNLWGVIDSASGYNIFGSGINSAAFNNTNQFFATDALLDIKPLQLNHIGLAPTHAIGGSSIAIDGGAYTPAPAADQRGLSPRVDVLGKGLTGVSTDIGAYEALPPVPAAGVVTVDEGASVIITQSMLSATDDDSAPEEITYTIASGGAPSHGTLFKNATALQQGSSFNQVDVLTFLLSYEHDGSEATQDSVTLTVEDRFGLTAEVTVQIDISPVNDAPTGLVVTPVLPAVPENTDLLVPQVVATIAVIDPDALGVNSVALSGPNADAFYLSQDQTQLYLQDQDFQLDHETPFSVTVTVDDAAVGQTPDATIEFELPIEDRNDRPVLGPPPAEHGFQWDVSDAANEGVLVSALIEGAFDEDGQQPEETPDVLGIAITATNVSRGPIQYKLSGGNWTNVGSIPFANGFLLPATARLRLDPDQLFDQPIADAVSYRAWDQTQGTEASLMSLQAAAGNSISSTINLLAMRMSFDSIVPADLVVSAPGDAAGSDYSGNLTFRQAVELAGFVPHAVTFDSSINSITLTNGEITLADGVTIIGPGADQFVIDANSASRVFNVAAGAAVSISGLTIQGGNAVNGGGILNAGTLTLSDAVLENNQATIGSALYVTDSGSVTMTRSLVAGNTAAGADPSAAAVYSEIDAGNQTYANVTISGNQGAGYFKQGDSGQSGASTGLTTFIHTTIVENQAGGVRSNSKTGSTALENSLIAANTGSDLSGTFGVSNYNLVGTETAGGISGSGTGNNVLGVAQTLAGLNIAALNTAGGPTRTHELLAGSPAIDGALEIPEYPADQRGYGPRQDVPGVNDPDGTTADIGAYEQGAAEIVDPPTVQIQSASVNENAPAGTFVHDLVVETPGSYDYAIEGGNPGNTFAIDGNGRITVANNALLDADLFPGYLLQVRVTDNTQTAIDLFSIGLVDITLIGVDEAPAIFGGPFEFSVDAQALSGDVVGRVDAADPEGDAVSFAWSGNNNFTIDENTGVVSVAEGAELASIAGNAVSGSVTATAGGLGSAPASVTINVGNLPAPPVLGSFTATDYSVSHNKTLTFNPFAELNDPEGKKFLITTTTPTLGTLTQNSEGLYVYDPNEGLPTSGLLTQTDTAGGPGSEQIVRYFELDTITYDVYDANDPMGTSGTKLLTGEFDVKVTNDLPVFIGNRHFVGGTLQDYNDSTSTFPGVILNPTADGQSRLALHADEAAILNINDFFFDSDGDTVSIHGVRDLNESQTNGSAGITPSYNATLGGLQTTVSVIGPESSRLRVSHNGEATFTSPLSPPSDFVTTLLFVTDGQREAGVPADTSLVVSSGTFAVESFSDPLLTTDRRSGTLNPLVDIVTANPLGYDETLSTQTQVDTLATNWTLNAATRQSAGTARHLDTVGGAIIDLNDGSLIRRQELLLDTSGGTAELAFPGLIFDSSTIDHKPVIQGRLQRLSGAQLPDTIKVKLTWFDHVNGVSQYGTGPTTWETELEYKMPAAGTPEADSFSDLYFSVQPAQTPRYTGVYRWHLDVELSFADDAPIAIRERGETPVISQETVFADYDPFSDYIPPYQHSFFESFAPAYWDYTPPFGAGWSLEGMPRLFVDDIYEPILGAGSNLDTLVNDRFIVSFPGQTPKVFRLGPNFSISPSDTRFDYRINSSSFTGTEDAVPLQPVTVSSQLTDTQEWSSFEANLLTGSFTYSDTDGTEYTFSKFENSALGEFNGGTFERVPSWQLTSIRSPGQESVVAVNYLRSQTDQGAGTTAFPLIDNIVNADGSTINFVYDDSMHPKALDRVEVQSNGAVQSQVSFDISTGNETGELRIPGLLYGIRQHNQPSGDLLNIDSGAQPLDVVRLFSYDKIGVNDSYFLDRDPDVFTANSLYNWDSEFGDEDSDAASTDLNPFGFNYPNNGESELLPAYFDEVKAIRMTADSLLLDNSLERSWGFGYDNFGLITDVFQGGVTQTDPGVIHYQVQSVAGTPGLVELTPWGQFGHPIWHALSDSGSGPQRLVTGRRGLEIITDRPPVATVTVSADDLQRIESDGSEETHGGDFITEYEFDDRGRLVRRTERFYDGATEDGLAISEELWTRDRLGSVKTYTDPKGRITYYEYDYETPPAYTGTQDPAGDDATPAYDENDYRGNVTKIVSVAGVEIFEYETDDENEDAVGRLVRSVDTTGVETKYERDNAGRLRKITIIRGNEDPASGPAADDPRDFVETWDYANGLLTTHVSALGLVTAYTHDSKRRVDTATIVDTGIDRELGTADDKDQQFIDYSYDDYGFLNTVKVYDGSNAGGSVVSTTDYDYDATGLLRRLRTLAPDNNVLTSEQYAYDPDGAVTLVIDGNSVQTVYEYDFRGLLVTETEAVGSKFDATHDGVGSPSLVERQTKYEYYSDGTLKKIERSGRPGDDDDVTVTYFYAYESVIEQPAEAGEPPTRTFLHSSRWTKTSGVAGAPDFTLGGASGYTFDPKSVDAIFREDVDSLGRTIAEEDLLTGAHTAYEYGDLRVDAPTKVTEKVNLGGPSAAEVDALFGYDQRGNVIFEKAPGLAAVHRAFDELGYLTESRVGVEGGARVEYETDPLGNATQTNEHRTEGDGSANQYKTERVYDQRGRLTTTTYRGPSDAFVADETIDYDFDDGEKKETITATSIDGLTTTQRFDAAGRLASERNPLGGTTTYAYDQASNLTETQFTPATNDTSLPARRTTYKYDGLNRLRRTIYHGDGANSTFATAVDYLQHGDPGMWDVLTVDAYASDANGNPTVAPGAVTKTQYDSLGQVVLVQQPSPYTADGPVTADDAPLTIYTYQYNTNNLTSTVTTRLTTLRAEAELLHTDRNHKETRVSRQKLNTRGQLLEYSERTALVELSGPVPVAVFKDTADDGFVLRQKNTYFADGQINVSSDADDHNTTYDYNEQRSGTNLLTSLTRPNGNQTDFGYDTAGNRVELRQILGENDVAVPADNKPDNVTHWTFDALGRVLTETITIDTQFDAAGNPTASGDVRKSWQHNRLANGPQTVYTVEKAYDNDALVRQVTTTTDTAARTNTETTSLEGSNYTITTTLHSDGSVQQAATNWTNGDRAGDSTALTFTYDEFGRRLTEASGFTFDGLTAPNMLLTNAYHESGVRQSAAWKHGTVDLLTNTYGTDRLNRVNSITQTVSSDPAAVALWETAPAFDKSITIDYNSDGSRSLLQGFVGGSQEIDTEYGYHDDGKAHSLLHSVVTDGAGSIFTVASYIAHFYDNGQLARSSFEFQDPNAPLADNGTLKKFGQPHDYTYDASGQLTSRKRTDADDPANETSVYDDAGNRADPGTAIVGRANRLLTNDSGETLRYDDEGRLVEATRHHGSALLSATTTYTWDHRGNLLSTEQTFAGIDPADTSVRTYYLVDALGRRVAQKISATYTEGTTVTEEEHEAYVYDGPDRVFDLDLSTGKITRAYTNGPNPGEVIAIDTAGDPNTDLLDPTPTPNTTIWVLADQVGTSRTKARKNADGDWVVLHQDFDKHGEFSVAEIDSSIEVDDILNLAPQYYHGGLYERITKFYDIGGQWHDPSSGRYITDQGGIDGYTYNRNDPNRGTEGFNYTGSNPNFNDAPLPTTTSGVIYDTVSDYAGAAYDNTLGNFYVQAGLQVAGGAAEVFGGAFIAVGTAPEPVTTVAGVLIALRGVDNVQAGLLQIVYGVPITTLTNQAVTETAIALGASQDTAQFLGFTADIGADIFTGFGAVRGSVKYADDAFEAISRNRLLRNADNAPVKHTGVADLPILNPSFTPNGALPELIYRQASRRGFATSKNQAVFWSGLGRDGVARSLAYVRTNGGTTLELTPGGRYLNDLGLFGANSPVTRAEAGQIFGNASREFARGASGQVRVLTGSSRPSSIFRTVEFPELIVNPSVTGIDVLPLRPAVGLRR